MRFEDVPLPVPRAGEVLLKVAGAGACHSDLHVEESAAAGKLPWKLPFTLGHEITGWVEALGDGVQGFGLGDAVAVYCAWGCGECAACAAGSDNYCEHPERLQGGGLGVDGGMASHVLIPQARYLVPLGDLEPRDAAPLADAGLTAFHAVKRCLPVLGEGSAAAVIGVGGLGHMAIQILRALSPARVIALDVNPDKLALATALGAHAGVRSDEDPLTAVRAANGGRPVDAVLDFVGAQRTVDLARKTVRPNGEIVVAGLAGGTLPIRQGAIPYGARVSMTFYGSIADLRETIALARSGRIASHVTRYPLQAAPEAFTAMRAGSLDGRAVILPNG
jgi:propanol-preferring alcohol dehydrogenase